MEKYEAMEMEIIRLESEDIITGSTETPIKNGRRSGFWDIDYQD